MRGLKNYNKGSILDVICEIDYQEMYTYEERVDLFNKYNLSTSTKYINPIMLLTQHLSLFGGEYYNNMYLRYHGLSHSGAVMSSFNKDYKSGKSPYIKVKESEYMNTVRVLNYSSTKKDMVEVMLYVEKEDGIKFSFKNITENLWLKRGYCVYADAEQYCKDFKFNLKFK